MPDLVMPWGGEELRISLPESWTLQQVAVPSLQTADPDWTERLALALNQPIAGPPLAELLGEAAGGRIVLVVEDITRHSPLSQILDVVMREVRHAGVDDERIEILLATGMHPPMTKEQAAQKLGAMTESLRWRCNPWDDERAYLPVGRCGRVNVSIDRGLATADLRIIISSVSPHLQAGFGGGYKMYLPGCASLETIRGLHRQGIGPNPRQLVGTAGSANRMRSVIDHSGQLIDATHGATFAVQYLLDDDDLPSVIATGQPMPVQQMLSKHCSTSCGVIVPAPADVLITNAHPRDFDLWQSFKCIPNTAWAARPNGVIICLTRCQAGMGGIKPPPWPINPTWTRRMFRLFGTEAVSSLLRALVPRIAADAAFFIRIATQTLYRNPIFMVSPTLVAQGARFPGIQLFADAGDAVKAADSLLGGGPQRAVAFPSGGITFPIPTTMAAK